MCIPKFQLGDLFEFFYVPNILWKIAHEFFTLTLPQGGERRDKPLAVPLCPPTPWSPPIVPLPPWSPPVVPSSLDGRTESACVTPMCIIPTHCNSCTAVPPSILLGFKVYLVYVHFLANKKRENYHTRQEFGQVKIMTKKRRRAWTFVIFAHLPNPKV